MSDKNLEQIQFWNKFGQRWVDHQESLDRVWQPLGDATISQAAVVPGERVVDVGCGCGTTTLQLAGRVGPQGSVIGIDVSSPMLGRARERARTLGVTNIDFIQADASTYRFRAVADLVFSRFGVMFFSDPVGAFANLRGSLRPRGRMVFVCFRDRALNSWWTVPQEALSTVPGVALPPPLMEPPLFSLADQTRLRTTLKDAGFTDIVCEAVDDNLCLGEDNESAADHITNSGSAAGILAAASDDVRARGRAALKEALAGCSGPAGIMLGAATWIVKATN